MTTATKKLSERLAETVRQVQWSSISPSWQSLASMSQQAAALEAQRNELLLACCEARQYIGIGDEMDQARHEIRAKLTAAIDAAKGTP